MKNLQKTLTKTCIRINIGLMGISFAFFLALLQVVQLDNQLSKALISCELIFPLCFMFGFVLQVRENNLGRATFIVLCVVTIGSVLVAANGLIDFLAHFSQLSEEFFTTSCVFAMGSYILVQSIDENRNLKTEKNRAIESKNDTSNESSNNE